MTTNFPEVAQIYADLQSVLEKLQALEASKVEDHNLVPMVKAIQAIGIYAGKVDNEIQLRAVGNGVLLPGVVVKTKVTHRKWHDGEAAAQLAQEEFGDAAFSRALLSPAGIEKLGPKGEQFVAVASFKPEGDKAASY